MERIEMDLLLKKKEKNYEFGGSKMKEVINVDKEDDEKLNDNDRKVATALANNMFERVNKMMKKV